MAKNKENKVLWIIGILIVLVLFSGNFKKEFVGIHLHEDYSPLIDVCESLCEGTSGCYGKYYECQDFDQFCLVLAFDGEDPDDFIIDCEGATGCGDWDFFADCGAVTDACSDPFSEEGNFWCENDVIRECDNGDWDYYTTCDFGCDSNFEDEVYYDPDSMCGSEFECTSPDGNLNDYFCDDGFIHRCLSGDFWDPFFFCGDNPDIPDPCAIEGVVQDTIEGLCDELGDNYCIDPDGGNLPNIFGCIEFKQSGVVNTFCDTCVGGVLTEYHCVGTVSTHTEHPCQYGCQDGECNLGNIFVISSDIGDDITPGQSKTVTTTFKSSYDTGNIILEGHIFDPTNPGSQSLIIIDVNTCEPSNIFWRNKFVSLTANVPQQVNFVFPPPPPGTYQVYVDAVTQCQPGATTLLSEQFLGSFSVISSDCGNSLINPGEACDSTNLVGKTCKSLGFESGTLSCKSNCQFDVSGCIGDDDKDEFPFGIVLAIFGGLIALQMLGGKK